MDTQRNNQLQNILKFFIQETNNQFQDQGVNIKNLENQVGQITYTFSSIATGALPSSIEMQTSTSGTKTIGTCKVISLRSGKEYKGAN